MTFFEAENLSALVESTLIEIIGRRPQSVITYRDLVDECALVGNLAGIDLSDGVERALFSNLLGKVADESFVKFGFILTAVVVLKTGDGAGTGLRTALVRNGLLKKSANDDAYELARFAEMRKAWEKFGPSR